MEEMICIKGMGQANVSEIKEENQEEEKNNEDDELRLKVLMKDLDLEKSRGKKLETDLNLIISGEILASEPV